MENKKIYVDGVDVSECEHYRAEIETKMPYGEYETLKDKCHYSGIEVIQNCKGNKGCIYKQLKRLQQENEQLKKSIDRIMQNKEIKTIDSEIALLNAELQQENKRLIARLRPLEDSYFKGLSSIEIAGLAKKSIRITAENRKLEDALQEIREIAKEISREKVHNPDIDTIIAKINEVIGAE